MSDLASAARVLIVDDELEIRAILARLIGREGYEPLEAATGDEALAMMRTRPFDAMLLDIKMPGLGGIEVLQQAKKLVPELPVVMITSDGTAGTAIAALRAGAHDYLVKPFEHDQVIRSLQRAVAGAPRRSGVVFAKEAAAATEIKAVMGSSPVVARVAREVGQVAATNFTVLLVGETGSGKEVVARAIHRASARAAQPFVAVDCGAIPEPLFESELFGHEKGAFTGADRGRPGKFELAAGGTLFLDEILNMPLGSQAKLLRALQERCIERVGGSKPIAVDVRVVAAANEAIEAARTRGMIRKDLFFRLSEFVIHIPPLRERKADIEFLAKRFLDETNRDLGKAVRGFAAAAMEWLLAQEWPGNVRELRSAIRRAVLLAGDQVDVAEVRGGALPPPGQPLAQVGGSLKEVAARAVAAAEREAVLSALLQAGWNRTGAARLLRIDYKTMRSKLKAYGITRPKER